MINVVVCDDDIRFAQLIGPYIMRIINDRNLRVNLALHDSGEELLESIRSGDPMDILFLDYDLSEFSKNKEALNGAEIAEILRERDRTFKLVFLSAYPEHTHYLFKHGMTSFVPKEKIDELLAPAVEQAVNQLLDERENLEVFSLVNDESNKSTLKISAKDIVYFSSANKNVTMHSNIDGQSFSLGRCSLNELEKRYSTHLFVRIDRPTLINVTFVTRFTDNSVTLQYVRNDNSVTEVTLRMSLRRKEAFKDIYWPWIHGK